MRTALLMGISSAALFASAGQIISLTKARYWRVFIETSNSTSYATIGELYFYDANGVRLPTTGTPISRGDFNTALAKAGAFDGIPGVSTDNRWASNAPPTNTWIGMDFGGPVEVHGFAMQCPNGVNEEMPKNGRLEYSDDGVTWLTDTYFRDQIAWQNAEIRTFKAQNGMRIFPFSAWLTNPGAESNYYPWVYLTESTYTAGPNRVSSGAQAGAAHTGTYYWAGASNSAKSQWLQTVGELPHDLVDAGKISVTLTAWMCGFDGDSDSGGLYLIAKDGDNNPLAWASSADLDPIAWTLVSVTLALPAGTRWVYVGGRSYRVTGTELSIYYDDFDVEIVRDEVAHTYVDTPPDTSTLTGWTAVAGTPSLSAGDGATFGVPYILFDGDQVLKDIYWRSDLPSASFDEIDADALEFVNQWELLSDSTEASADSGRVYLEFEDESGTLIGERVYDEDALYTSTSYAGAGKSMKTDIPIGARAVRFGFVAQSNTTETDTSFPVVHRTGYLQQRTAPSPELHKHWRVLIDEVGAGLETSATAIMYLEMKASRYGPNLCIGGTATASDVHTPGNGYAPELAFDTDFYETSTGGTVQGWAADGTVGNWIAYEFVDPVEVNALTMMGRAYFTTQGPTAFTVQYSDDGTTWTDHWSYSGGAAWTSREVREFANPDFDESAYTGSPHGVHKHWKLISLKAQGTAGNHNQCSFAELEFRAAPGSADQAVGGTATASSIAGSTYDATKAFDDDPATLWAAADGALPPQTSTLSYEFTEPVSVGEIALTARNDAYFDNAPAHFMILYSDNGADWTMAMDVTTDTWVQAEQKVFTDPAYVGA